MSAPVSSPFKLGTTAGALLPDVLNQSFPAAMTRDALIGMRDSLSAQQNGDLVAFFLFAAMDSDTMVAGIQNLLATEGDDATWAMITAPQNVVENLQQVLDIAKRVAARTLIAAHVALGERWPDDVPAEAAA